MMNVESLSASSSSGAGGPPVNHRKERGAIAAQACETCRSRKQKCDEQRPKCGTCQKFKLECRYREPQPTKKDKTLGEILDRLKCLEGKIDSLSLRGSIAPSLQASLPAGIPTSTQIVDRDDVTNHLVDSPILSPATSSHPSPVSFNYRSSAYRMFSWPVVQQRLENTRPWLQGHGNDERPTTLFELQSQAPPLSVDGIESIETIGVNDKMPLNLQLQVPSSSANLPLSSSAINWETMERLSKAYFDSFNLICPVMDRQHFNNNIIDVLIRDGFDEQMPTTLACLIFALGEVALSTSTLPPITGYKSRASGVKGGSLDRPPGLAFFNEARKRMGFSLSECSIENVQMFALAGIYYGSCFHHTEYWRMTGTASLACQALLTSKPDELASARGDLIKRLFWHCCIGETCLHLELEVPLSGLEKFEEMVGLVDFGSSFCQEDYIANQASHFQEHFLSQIVLRKLAVNFHAALQAGLGSTTAAAPAGPQTPRSPLVTNSTSANSGRSAVQTDAADIHAAVVTATQLGAQLDQWRNMLPPFLRWSDSQPGAFCLPNIDMFGQDLSTTLMFSSDLDSPPAIYAYTVDIQVALLRSRYYHAKLLIYRPFVYKAIHGGDHITREDADCVANCLQACLKWPIAMSPTCCNKRLIPYICFWTQNIASILVLLHLSQQIPILARIRATLCHDGFDAAANETIALYLDWLRDLKTVDPVARWFWAIVREIYRLDE